MYSVIINTQFAPLAAIPFTNVVITCGVGRVTREIYIL